MEFENSKLILSVTKTQESLLSQLSTYKSVVRVRENPPIIIFMLIGVIP